MAQAEDEEGFEPTAFHGRLSVQVRLNALGGVETTSAKMKAMGLAPTLSEVDRTKEDLQSDVILLAGRMALPEVVRAEAVSIALMLPLMDGVTVRERTLFCVYMAGKRQGTPRADITFIADALKDVDGRWTRGRILRSVGQIHARLPQELRERIGSIAPTSVGSYVEQLFMELARKNPRALAMLGRARVRAFKMAREVKEVELSESPKSVATRIVQSAVEKELE